MADKKMKKIFVILFLFASIPSVSFAHFVESNAEVTSVMHLSPLDDPVIGSPAQISLEFKDAHNELNFQNCECTIKITDGSGTLSEGKLTMAGNFSLPYEFVFPKKNTYTIFVSGKVDHLSFQNEFSVTIEREKNTDITFNLLKIHSQHLIIYGLGFTVALFFIVRELVKTRKNKAVK